MNTRVASQPPRSPAARRGSSYGWKTVTLLCLGELLLEETAPARRR